MEGKQRRKPGPPRKERSLRAGTQVTFNLYPEVEAALRARADSEGTHVATLVRRWVMRELGPVPLPGGNGDPSKQVTRLVRGGGGRSRRTPAPALKAVA